MPLRSISLQHINSSGLDLLTFYYEAAAIDAVDAMLKYNPIMTDTSSSLQRYAAFLITTTNDRSAPLLVRAVRAVVDTGNKAPAPVGTGQGLPTPNFVFGNPPVVGYSGGSLGTRNSKPSQKQIGRLVTAATIPAATIATLLSSLQAPFVSSVLHEAPEELAAAAVGLSHPVFGEHLKEAVLSVFDNTTTPLSWDICTAILMPPAESCGPLAALAAPGADLWVVSW
jgi:hypothetical protein